MQLNTIWNVKGQTVGPWGNLMDFPLNNENV